jgi:hypothetical protein
MDQDSDIKYDPNLKITLIGTGTIGLSFLHFHLTHLPSPSQITIYDTRPKLRCYLHSTLPLSLLSFLPHINLAETLEAAVSNAHIIQESGPENLPFKQNLWKEVEKHAPKDALLWSSTSGIPASRQNEFMVDQSRLVVVHPYNPPRLMPLIEVVPSPMTSQSVLDRTQTFWTTRGRTPIIIKKETTGFVANRLAFALLREAIHLVETGVVSVEDVDKIVETSMGPRWSVAGPFKSYHAGGGEGGLKAFFSNIGGTVGQCWQDQGPVQVGGPWQELIFEEAEKTYGVVDVKERDRITKRVLEVLKEEREKGEQDGD